ncbi:nuclease-related domain-containing protein [Lysinibacillus pakistanensis]|uniref:NERD domain-containing protein n=1 Tax=Lysinibacillus pakistanensis TaxID=759811 RepID=A0AAX3WS55_9BACI|nr:nuclease-related domain-containing protein [Lysinibacillus pakistanensis]MDM5229952.1 nuclease-related domain-containing protein [Lysinibacillus pakistanensis]QGG52767.1 NERD domain-containing protein [Lysinibacillus pakistanensis]WHY45551.1 nuclease-related domain-containing protein [Lysinibacillus pakistanensis]WHY50559.1 nuclease-related domain-containing protein [Lysinibacillus pakistanensis]
MAQLVKLQDYISRYQIDLARYPTQFVRLKKSQWERVKRQWELGEDITEWQHTDSVAEQEPFEEKERFSILKKLFAGRQKEEKEDIEQLEISNELVSDEDSIPEEETTLTFEPQIVYAPQSIHELKRMFIDQFFHFQMKWASSTLREKSYVDPRFMRDSLLRNFLQQLPDNYLLFYYPILQIRKAPIELDVVLMSPTECICITVLEAENQAVYVGGSDRFWIKKVGTKDSKVLNPTINLSRMESVLTQLFKQDNIDMPIRKVVLTRNGYFDYPGSPYGVQFIDNRNYGGWMEHLKKVSSPMKHMQIRAAQTILNNVQTTSFNRDIWQQSSKQAED